MKRRVVVAVVLILAMTIMLNGCGFDLPFLSKPEDAVNEFMTQDSLMEVISRFDDTDLEADDDFFSLFWLDFLSSSSMKSLMLDNVRSIDYTITDVSTKGDKATITALITHHDLSPIVDRAIEGFIKRLEEFDASGEVVPEDEDEALELFFSVLRQSFKEAVAKAKPSETYSKVRFDAYKNSIGKWELREIPDDFIDKVLLMNLQSAVEESVDNKLNDYLYS